MELHSKLNHPNIIRFYSSIETSENIYFLLEYAPKNALFYYIHAEDGLPEDLALRFFYQTALGLKNLHDQLIIHRDLKPENVLLSESFNVKLCDFGWASQLQSKYDSKNVICGTFEYMSPEVLNERDHSWQTDIWSLGIFLYEMLTGKTPLNANNFDEMRIKFKMNAIQISKQFSPEIRELLKFILKLKEEQRPTIDEILNHPIFRGKHDLFLSCLSPLQIKLMMTNFMLNTLKGEARSKILEEGKDLLFKNEYNEINEEIRIQNQNIEMENRNFVYNQLKELIYQGEYDEDIKDIAPKTNIDQHEIRFESPENFPDFQINASEQPAPKPLIDIDHLIYKGEYDADLPTPKNSLPKKTEIRPIIEAEPKVNEIPFFTENHYELKVLDLPRQIVSTKNISIENNTSTLSSSLKKKEEEYQEKYQETSAFKSKFDSPVFLQDEMNFKMKNEQPTYPTLHAQSISQAYQLDISCVEAEKAEKPEKEYKLVTPQVEPQLTTPSEIQRKREINFAFSLIKNEKTKKSEKSSIKLSDALISEQSIKSLRTQRVARSCFSDQLNGTSLPEFDFKQEEKQDCMNLQSKIKLLQVLTKKRKELDSKIASTMLEIQMKAQNSKKGSTHHFHQIKSASKGPKKFDSHCFIDLAKSSNEKMKSKSKARFEPKNPENFNLFFQMKKRIIERKEKEVPNIFGKKLSGQSDSLKQSQVGKELKMNVESSKTFIGPIMHVKKAHSVFEL